MSPVGEKRRKRRLVVWLLVTLCVLADLIGVGALRASGASGLGAPVISPVGLPTDPTTARSAVFMFTYDRTADFRCRLDGANADCGSGIFGQAVYEGPLALGHPGGVLSTEISTTTDVTKIAAAFGFSSVSTIGRATPGARPATSPEMSNGSDSAVELSPAPASEPPSPEPSPEPSPAVGVAAIVHAYEAGGLTSLPVSARTSNVCRPSASGPS